MLGKIVSVAVLSDRMLQVVWDDERVATVDLSKLIAANANLSPLRDEVEFGRVAVSADGWSLEWPSGIDFGSTQVRRWTDEQSGEGMSPQAFRAWIDRHGLTQDQAAQALGLSRRTIGYYLSGEQPISKTVLLATRGWEGRIDA